MEIDISKLKAGDSYYNKVEGWVKIRGVDELSDGSFDIVDAMGQFLRAYIDGVNVDWGRDSDWTITEVKIAAKNKPKQEEI